MKSGASVAPARCQDSTGNTDISAGGSMALEKEIQFFEQHRSEWITHYEGKFALVVCVELVGTFDTSEAAYEVGVERFGNVPMLIKQIVREDSVACIPALTLGLICAHP